MIVMGKHRLTHTSADIRGIRILVRFGGGSATTRGYWLSGGHRISQTTITRLIASGLIVRDGPSRVVPTEDGCEIAAQHRASGPDEAAIDSELRWDDVRFDPRPISLDSLDDVEAWAPPDYVDDFGLPLPTDVAVGGDDD